LADLGARAWGVADCLYPLGYRHLGAGRGSNPHCGRSTSAWSQASVSACAHPAEAGSLCRGNPTRTRSPGLPYPSSGRRPRPCWPALERSSRPRSRR